MLVRKALFPLLANKSSFFLHNGRQTQSWRKQGRSLLVRVIYLFSDFIEILPFEESWGFLLFWQKQSQDHPLCWVVWLRQAALSHHNVFFITVLPSLHPATQQLPVRRTQLNPLWAPTQCNREEVTWIPLQYQMNCITKKPRRAVHTVLDSLFIKDKNHSSADKLRKEIPLDNKRKCRKARNQNIAYSFYQAFVYPRQVQYIPVIKTSHAKYSSY